VLPSAVVDGHLQFKQRIARPRADLSSSRTIAKTARQGRLAIRQQPEKHDGCFDDIRRLESFFDSLETLDELTRVERAKEASATARLRARATDTSTASGVTRQGGGTLAAAAECAQQADLVKDIATSMTVEGAHRQIIAEAVRRPKMSKLAMEQVALARERARRLSWPTASAIEQQREWLARVVDADVGHDHAVDSLAVSTNISNAAADWLQIELCKYFGKDVGKDVGKQVDNQPGLYAHTTSKTAMPFPSSKGATACQQGSGVPHVRIRQQRVMRARAVLLDQYIQQRQALALGALESARRRSHSLPPDADRMSFDSQLCWLKDNEANARSSFETPTDPLHQSPHPSQMSHLIQTPTSSGSSSASTTSSMIPEHVQTSVSLDDVVASAPSTSSSCVPAYLSLNRHSSSSHMLQMPSRETSLVSVKL